MKVEGREKGWLETQFLAAHCTAGGTPTRPPDQLDENHFVEWSIYQMKSSLLSWGYFILACLGLYLWMGRLSLMRTSLTLSLVTYSPILLPILCPCRGSCLSPCICSFCPHPGGKMAVADSPRVSFSLCLTALCESVLCWIDFQCIGFCLSALEPRRLALIVNFAALWFPHWPLSASLSGACNKKALSHPQLVPGLEKEEL